MLSVALQTCLVAAAASPLAADETPRRELAQNNRKCRQMSKSIKKKLGRMEDRDCMHELEDHCPVTAPPGRPGPVGPSPGWCLRVARRPRPDRPCAATLHR